MVATWETCLCKPMGARSDCGILGAIRKLSRPSAFKQAVKYFDRRITPHCNGKCTWTNYLDGATTSARAQGGAASSNTRLPDETFRARPAAVQTAFFGRHTVHSTPHRGVACPQPTPPALACPPLAPTHVFPVLAMDLHPAATPPTRFSPSAQPDF